METYSFRLMIYELRVGRSRWYGAALAAAVAYMAAGLVTHPFALMMMTVGVILGGVTLAFQLFLYENAALQLRWLIESQKVAPGDLLDGPFRAHPVLAIVFHSSMWQFIAHLGGVVVVDRAFQTFPQIGEIDSIRLILMTAVSSYYATLPLWVCFDTIRQVRRNRTSG